MVVMRNEMLDENVVSEAGNETRPVSDEACAFIQGKNLNLSEKTFSASIFSGRIRSERGAGMVEYALLVTLMSIGCMGAISLMRVGVREAFRDVQDGLACTGVGHHYDPETNVCGP